ncbi:MAG: hypothetical protein ABJE10_07955 [bacterium]
MSPSTRRALFATLGSLLLGACGGSAASGPATPTTPTTPTTSATTARITLQVVAPPTLYSGDIYYRAGTAAIARSAFTFQDGKCASGPGSKTCTIDVPIGQTVSIAANDQQADIYFANVAFNAQNVDPRSLQSQFASFTGACTLPERGVCVVDAKADQTITVTYKGLDWTRVNFIGSANFQFTISAPAVLAISTNIKPSGQFIIEEPIGGQFANQCAADLIPTHCYTLRTADNTTMKFDAVAPLGPQPMGSPGPIAFRGFQDACASAGTGPSCTLTGSGDRLVTMKWEYYQCAQVGATNPLWKFPVGVFPQCVLMSP